MSLRPTLLFALLQYVDGHGMMDWPPSRHGNTMDKAGRCTAPRGGVSYHEADDEMAGSCFWFNQGCQIGCEKCTGQWPNENCTTPGLDGVISPLCTTEPICNHSMEPTLNDPMLRTFPNWTDPVAKYNPWRAPGYAPIINPCGMAGAWITDPGWVGHHDGGWPPLGYTFGFKGTDLPEGPITVWKAGSTEKVAWQFWANHGGGYQYRLCPKNSDLGLTEECFQLTPVEFVGNSSFIVWGDDWTTSTPIPAIRVSEGVKPVGSQWTRNPIPFGYGHMHDAPNSYNPQWSDPVFEPPLPGLHGGGVGPWCASPMQDRDPAFKPPQPYGSCSKELWDKVVKQFNFSIVDEVRVPSNLEVGDYLLSWRWDSEMTPQVWAGCSDIRIEAAEEVRDAIPASGNLRARANDRRSGR